VDNLRSSVAANIEAGALPGLLAAETCFDGQLQLFQVFLPGFAHLSQHVEDAVTIF
jgi:hypothetical protein